MRKTTKILSALALCCALPAAAADLGGAGSLAQGEFRRLSEDLGAAFAYKGVTPATPLGLTGFDIGVEVTTTSMERSQILALAGAGGVSDLVIPKIHAHKGLWGGFDIGAFVGGASDIDATLFGAELRYAIVDDGIATPAVGLRLSGTRTTGTGDLRVGTIAFDVVVSKRFTALTPYVGGGTVRVQSKVNGSPLAEESFNQGRLFAGLNFNMLTANLAVEAEKMGDNMSWSAKLGFRF